MTKTTKGTPESPRDWDPNHQSLKSQYAPHETAGVLRMQRAGYPSKEIAKILGLKGLDLMNTLQTAIDAEAIASRRGVQIHDAMVDKGTV